MSSSPAHAPTFRRGDLSGLEVLVVDDEPDARELIQRVLEDSAAVVTTAPSAGEALALFCQRPPDVLVSDIGMPDMDGMELLRRVREFEQKAGLGHVPAIAVTAFARAEDRARILRAGFSVHVPKPMRPSELVGTVARVAGRGDGQGR